MASMGKNCTRPYARRSPRPCASPACHQSTLPVPATRRGPRRREPDGGPDALADHGGEEAHEGHRHGQPVPHQANIAGIQVIPGRAEAGEAETREEQRPGPALPAVDERRRGRPRPGPARARPPAIRKARLDSTLSALGTPRNVPGVGEAMVGGILRHRGHPPREHEGGRRYPQQDPDPAAPSSIPRPCGLPYTLRGSCTTGSTGGSGRR